MKWRNVSSVVLPPRPHISTAPETDIENTHDHVNDGILSSNEDIDLECGSNDMIQLTNKKGIN